MTNIEKTDEILNLANDILLENYISYDNTIINNVKLRQKGKEFSFDEHIKGLVFSLLSKQRPWKPIKDNMDNIIEIFFNFNKEKIIETDASYFENKLKEISCGNRSIKAQMHTLKENISTLEDIEAQYKSLDNFVEKYHPRRVAQKLSSASSKHKLKQVGFALALEYIRNIGIDAPKPDVHLCRIVSSSRLGFSAKESPSERETLSIIEDMSKKSNYTQVEIDSILWHFCAEGYGDICTSQPKCNICRLSKFCNNEGM